MTTFFDSKGKIVLSVVGSAETIENVLADPAYSSYSYIDKTIDPESYYIDIVTKQPIPIPERPSLDYIFNYDTHTWVLDRIRAARRAINIRSQLLADSDWTDTLSAQNRFGSDLYNQWQTYRQALRDIPEQAGFPLSIIWPTPPA
jgi:hypothetical protein